MLSPRVAIESIGRTGVILFHPDHASRLKLTPCLYEIVRQFEGPTRLEDVLPEDARRESAKTCLRALITKGYLVDPDSEYESAGFERERVFTPTPYTLFRCPRAGMDEKASDVGVVGVPFDLGVASWAGARRAPEAIRERSNDADYRRDVATGLPRGWFDIQRRAHILAGVTFSDYGNIWFRHGEPLEAIHTRIGQGCRVLDDQGTFPLFLGGDHSIAYPIIRALQTRGRLSVLYFDAHTDSDRFLEGTVPNAVNVGRAILSLPNVARLVQVGHRGYTLNNKLETGTDRHRIVTAWDIREQGPEAVLAALPADTPCYISVDINCLDPAFAPGTCTPSPEGFSLGEFKRIARAVGESRHIVGLDVCEVNPEIDSGPTTTKSACHLIFAVLGAIEHQFAAPRNSGSRARSE
ncbi:MAG TPA: arginase family protein [Longimicrobiaceae bacterium]|jgi:agmatinase